MTLIGHTIISKDVHFLKLSLPLSSAGAREVEQKLREIAMQGGRRVILDLADVPFIDRNGLDVLVKALKLLGNDAKNLQLLSPQVQPRLVFELTGYDRIFHITHESGIIPVAA